MPPRKTTSAPSDTPFVYKSKTGAEVHVPAGTEFDPDADAMIALSDALSGGSEMDQVAATLKMIKSGFPPKVAEGIRLKLSEVEDFSRKYFAFAGVELPK